MLDLSHKISMLDEVKVFEQVSFDAHFYIIIGSIFTKRKWMVHPVILKPPTS